MFLNYLLKYLYGVGFEPTRPKPADLKSAPLTTRATVQIFYLHYITLLTHIIIYIFFKCVYEIELYYKLFCRSFVLDKLCETKIECLENSCQN